MFGACCMNHRLLFHHTSTMFQLHNTASHVRLRAGDMTAPASIVLTDCVPPGRVFGQNLFLWSHPHPLPPPPPPPPALHVLSEHMQLMQAEVNRFPLGWHRRCWRGRVTLWQLLLASLSLLRESVPKPQVACSELLPPPPHTSTPPPNPFLFPLHERQTRTDTNSSVEVKHGLKHTTNTWVQERSLTSSCTLETVKLKVHLRVFYGTFNLSFQLNWKVLKALWMEQLLSSMTSEQLHLLMKTMWYDWKFVHWLHVTCSFRSKVAVI